MMRVCCRTCGSIFLVDNGTPGPCHCPACSTLPLFDPPPKPKPKRKPKQQPNDKDPDHGTDRPS